MKNKKMILIASLLIVLILSAGCRKQQKEPVVVVSQAIDNTVEWDEKRYIYNQSLTNILFLGIDKSAPLNEVSIPGEAGQADFIMILSLNSENEQAALLIINRNTMTELDVYDMSGSYLKSMNGQIALQFAYDIGGENSCWATKKTVKELLYGLEIDGYFAMEIGALSEINDMLGGVDVTMRQDYTPINASFTEGSTVHLSGEAAEQFVRYRDLSTFNSVEDRMHRQADYVTAMLKNIQDRDAGTVYSLLSPYLDTYVMTDLGYDQLNQLAACTYYTDDVQYLPGEMVSGEEYEEYYLDEEALQELLIRTFYIEVKDNQ